MEKCISTDFLENLRKITEAFYFGLRVKVRPVFDIEKTKVASRINEYSMNKQYNAGNILKVLQDKLPKDAYCMIGICITDLYPRDEWNFGNFIFKLYT